MATTKKGAEQKVTIRRSPRLSAFAVAFGLIGFLGTLIVTSLYEADPSIGFATLFAYFSLYGITGSMAVGIALWLILDLRSKRREVHTVMAREEGSED
jgi:carbon starvation protein CstA